MPQAVIDPDEVRQFARTLKKFNTNLRDNIASLGSQLTALGSSWRDQEQQKFVELFDQHMKDIARFSDTADEMVPYLLRKAEHIEEYLRS